MVDALRQTMIVLMRLQKYKPFLHRKNNTKKLSAKSPANISIFLICCLFLNIYFLCRRQHIIAQRHLPGHVFGHFHKRGLCRCRIGHDHRLPRVTPLTDAHHERNLA